MIFIKVIKVMKKHLQTDVQQVLFHDRQKKDYLRK